MQVRRKIKHAAGMEKSQSASLAPTGIFLSDMGLISLKTMSSVKGSSLLIAADAFDCKCRQVQENQINTTINVLSLYIHWVVSLLSKKLQSCLCIKLLWFVLIWSVVVKWPVIVELERWRETREWHNSRLKTEQCKNLNGRRWQTQYMNALVLESELPPSAVLWGASRWATAYSHDSYNSANLKHCFKECVISDA